MKVTKKSESIKQKRETFRWNQRFKNGNSRDDDPKRKYWRRNRAVDRKPKNSSCDLICTNWRDREQNRYVEKRERSRWC